MDNNKPENSSSVENKKIEENFLNLTVKSTLSGKVIKNITRLDSNKLKTLGINKCLIKAISNKSEPQKVDECANKISNDVTIPSRNKLSETISKRFNDIDFKSKLNSLTIKNQLVIKKVQKPNLNTINNSKNSESEKSINTLDESDKISLNKNEKERKSLATALLTASSSKKSGEEKIKLTSAKSEITKVPILLQKGNDKQKTSKNKSLELNADFSTSSKSTNNNSKLKLESPKDKSKIKTLSKVENKNIDDTDDDDFCGFDSKTIYESQQKNNDEIKQIDELITKIKNESKTNILEQKIADNNKTVNKSEFKKKSVENFGIVQKRNCEVDTLIIEKSLLSKRSKKSLNILPENPAIITSTPHTVKRGRKRKISQNDGDQSDIKSKVNKIQNNKECINNMTQSASKKIKLDISNVSSTKVDKNMIETINKKTVLHNTNNSIIDSEVTSLEAENISKPFGVESDSTILDLDKQSSKTKRNSKSKSDSKTSLNLSNETDKLSKSQKELSSKVSNKNKVVKSDKTIEEHQNKRKTFSHNKIAEIATNDTSKILDKDNKAEKSIEHDDSILIEKTANVESEAKIPVTPAPKKAGRSRKSKIICASNDMNLECSLLTPISKVDSTTDSLVEELSENQNECDSNVTIESKILSDESKLTSKRESRHNVVTDKSIETECKSSNSIVQDKVDVINKPNANSAVEIVESVVTPVPKRPSRKKISKITETSLESNEMTHLIKSDKELDNEMENSLIKNKSLKRVTPEKQFESSTPVSRSKRSRRNPKLIVVTEECKTKDSSNDSEEKKKGKQSESILVTPVSNKQVRKRSTKHNESIITLENLEENKNERIVNDDNKKSASQRKNRKSVSNINADNLKIIVDKPSICGNCKLSIEAADWDSHLLFHNGVAWREGIDQEILISDYKHVLNTMINYMKLNKITQVKCEKCDEIRKSAIGLLSHKELCGLTPEEIENLKEKCPHCETRCRPSGLHVHITNCAGLRQKMLMEKQEKLSKDDEPEVLTDAGRVKRKTTTLATKTLNKYIETYVEGLIIEPKRVRITGGTVVSWKKQLSNNGVAKCINADCKFVNTNIDVIRIHSYDCNTGLNNLFSCRSCDFKTELKETCRSHILEAHPYKIETLDDLSGSDSDASVGEESSESEGDDGEPEAESSDGKSDEEGEDEDDNGKNKAKKRVRVKSSRLADLNQPSNPIVIYEKLILSDYYQSLKIPRSQARLYYTKSFKWTNEFRELYYSEFLYPNLLPPKIFMELKKDEVEEYLPDKKESLKYFVTKVNKYNLSYNERKVKENDWSTLKCFEGNHNNGTQTIFCGGPIISMEWAPLPDKDKTESSQQILAVCCKKNENDVVHHCEKTPKKCLIQIWSFDLSLNSTEIPKLLYAIPYDDGYILDMKFCPSGCYDNEMTKDTKRLGLLAVGSFYGEVNIFSLPLLENNDTNSSKFIKLEPSLTLISDRSDKKLSNLVSKISWTKAKEHSKLVAGFVNGFISVWNLNTKSILLKINEKELLCNIIFQAHLLPIKSLVIFYVNNSRWLMTGSTDRKNKFYDLLGKPLPQLISKNLFKSQITCGDWFTNWTTYFVGLDESLAFRNGGIMYHQPLQFGNRTAPILTSEASITDISCNDFLNAYASCMDSGDIYAGFPQQLLFNYLDKNIREFRCVIGYTDYCQLNKEDQKNSTNENEETMFDENKIINENDYGLVFCDINEPLKLDGTLGVKRMRRPKFNKYFLTKTNQIRFNPNKYNCYHYAIGYETGLVRIRELKK